MKLLILGNGISRLNYKEFITLWKNEIWGCNSINLEIQNIPQLKLIGTVHDYYYDVLKEFKEQNNLNFEILGTKQFKQYNGYCTGNELIREALLRNYTEIYLLGFDSINNSNFDIYMKTVVISNFTNQLNLLIKEYNLKLKKYNKDIFILERK